MTGTVEVRVRYSETDQMGRAHHRHYLVWCELGRTALMREHGVSYAQLEREGLLLPVARAELEYRAPILYDEGVRICTRVERVRSREVVFAYQVFRVDEEGEELLAANVRTVLVSTDAEGRPTRLPAPVREALVELAG